MIEEADLLRAVKIIGECLVDLDKVRVCVHLGFSWVLMVATSVFQLDEIPGEVESEKGFKNAISN